jgi:aminoglycoside phosphotransferase (APT) family kinase protein
MVGEELSRALRGVVGAEVSGLTRLSGGASRETWAFDARHADGSSEPLILRRDPPGAARVSGGGMGLEARAIATAGRHGVPVPPILASSDDAGALGAPFIVMGRIDGETIPRRILRDDAYAAARERLAADCGTVLARLHAIDPGEVGGLDEQDQVGQYRDALDALGQPHPAFELGLRWLEDNRPVPGPAAVVHGDFRNGNLIVGPDGLRAVLDWELVHAGDPLEDLGWLCVRAWRFGVDRPVGGFGDYDELLGAYAAERGVDVDRQALRWWEVLGTLKWGVMCIMQAATHTSGLVRSVELAAIGRRVCENEWDLLELLPQPWGGRGASPPAAGQGWSGAPHDMPDAPGLVEAVREFLQGDVMGATSGRVQFHARVASNVLGVVERELRLGPAHAARHAAGLAGLGYADEAAVAAAIRDGSADDHLADVAAFCRATVRDKLDVANPRYVG